MRVCTGCVACAVWVTLNSGTRGSVVRVAGVRDAYSIRIGKQVLCIERSPGGVTIERAIIDPLTMMEF